MFPHAARVLFSIAVTAAVAIGTFLIIQHLASLYE